MIWTRWRRVRQAAQILFLGLFIFLLAARLTAGSVPADLFFRLNPLSVAAAMLAGRAWLPGLGLALLTLGVTLLLGRVWCGWVCPLGSLLEWTAFRQVRKRATSLCPRWRLVKYLLLLLILVAALLGNLTLLILDPLAILTRTATTAIIPALQYGVNAVEVALYPVGFFRPALDWFESWARGSLLPVKQPVFSQNLFIAALLAGIVALNLLADRFWCRYLCPLGALLGLAARVAFLRPVIGPACNQCSRCVRTCRPGAINSSQPGIITILPSECTVCLDCLVGCPKAGIALQPSLHPTPGFDPSRRQALGTAAAGLAGVLLLRTDLRARQRDPLLLRPPGVADEAAFLSACLRCGECMNICPTVGLQPALGQAGLEGLWTPVLIPRLGQCDYGCNACGQACPSEAIPRLSLEQKRGVIIGLAAVNRDRCLPWASGVPCIVCEEMCPRPDKAIWLEEVTVAGPAGAPVAVQRPSVLRDLCTGCGICENHCPLEGEAGIRVYWA